MKRAFVLFGLCASLVALLLVMRALGLAEHTSFLAGMPLSSASWTLGPLYVATHLVTVILAPILLLAGALELLASRLRLV
jgi:hypothetical protein